MITPLNHIRYNLFSKHGPTLYGVEPWTYYILNGLLNFNIIYPLAFIGIVLTPLIDLFIDRRSIQSGHASIPNTMIVSSIVFWMGLLWMQPHKEDRFVSPIYPLIILSSSIAIYHLENLIPRLIRLLKLNRNVVLKLRLFFVYSIILIHGIISISRTVSIVDGYSAPIRLLVDSKTREIFQNDSSNDIHVCIGKDWYRFPSHFLLPSKCELSFIRSEFRGQLPKAYSQLKNATRLVEKHFNDENREEIDRYIDIDQCDYLIDHDSEHPTDIEPNYSQTWKKINSKKMLLPSHRSIFRSFYVPFLSSQKNRYTWLHLLKHP